MKIRYLFSICVSFSCTVSSCAINPHKHDNFLLRLDKENVLRVPIVSPLLPMVRSAAQQPSYGSMTVVIDTGTFGSLITDERILITGKISTDVHKTRGTSTCTSCTVPTFDVRLVTNAEILFPVAPLIIEEMFFVDKAENVLLKRDDMSGIGAVVGIELAFFVGYEFHAGGEAISFYSKKCDLKNAVSLKTIFGLPSISVVSPFGELDVIVDTGLVGGLLLHDNDLYTKYNDIAETPFGGFGFETTYKDLGEQEIAIAGQTIMADVWVAKNMGGESSSIGWSVIKKIGFSIHTDIDSPRAASGYFGDDPQWVCPAHDLRLALDDAF